MNGSEDARYCWNACNGDITEYEMPDLAWECFIEEACQHEKFTDEDGEWLPKYDSDDKLMATDEWKEYCIEFCATMDSIQSEVKFLEDDCGGDMYSYYGVSRSDFA